MPSRLIEIPCDDIFRNDRLGLEPAIASHTTALLARSPQAIAIDGHWGTGKSTFLALWAAYLRREGVKVVQFNPWKSFEADPFEALTKQILRQVDIPADEQGRSHKRLLAFLKDSAPTLARGGAKLIASLEPQLEDLAEPIGVAAELAQGSAGLGSAEGSAPKIQSPDAFAALLSSAAKSWSDRPIVVMVDELDRCSPEYAVEVLQLLEHVFHTDHVVFVVAVNQSELIHSIRSFYGEGFNAEGYLERFFDVILPLPASRRSQYVETSLQPLAPHGTSVAVPFLESSGLSLREIDKSVEHLKSVVGVAGVPPYGLIDLWIVRTLVPVEYRQFLSGEISDMALADAVFAKGTCGRLRTERQGGNSWAAGRIEATLIMGSFVLPQGSAFSYSLLDDPATGSELYRYHEEVGAGKAADSGGSDSHSQSILRTVSEALRHMLPDQIFGGMRLAASLLDREPPPE